MTDRPTEVIADQPDSPAAPLVSDAPPELEHLYRLWRVWCTSAEMSRERHEAEPTDTSWRIWIHDVQLKGDARRRLHRELIRAGRGRRWRVEDTVIRIATEASGNRRDVIIAEEAPR
ncbi:unnamed protein product [uncultured bacterium]|nr:unnamed protein product [uncultured bacterium]